MSRPKVITIEAEQLIHDEALRRVEYRRNKELAQLLADRGVHLSPQYIGQLVKQEARRIREQREFSLHADVSPRMR